MGAANLNPVIPVFDSLLSTSSPLARSRSSTFTALFPARGKEFGGRGGEAAGGLNLLHPLESSGTIASNKADSPTREYLVEFLCDSNAFFCGVGFSGRARRRCSLLKIPGGRGVRGSALLRVPQDSVSGTACPRAILPRALKCCLLHTLCCVQPRSQGWKAREHACPCKGSKAREHSMHATR